MIQEGIIVAFVIVFFGKVVNQFPKRSFFHWRPDQQRHVNPVVGGVASSQLVDDDVDADAV
jgi:hypothetical protein